MNLTGDNDTLETAKKPVESFLEAIPTNDGATSSSTTVIKGWNRSMLLPAVNEGFIVPSQVSVYLSHLFQILICFCLLQNIYKVNYVVKGASVLNPGEDVSGSYSVVSRYLSTNYMWNQVRGSTVNRLY